MPKLTFEKSVGYSLLLDRALDRNLKLFKGEKVLSKQKVVMLGDWTPRLCYVAVTTLRLFFLEHNAIRPNKVFSVDFGDIKDVEMREASGREKIVNSQSDIGVLLISLLFRFRVSAYRVIYISYLNGREHGLIKIQADDFLGKSTNSLYKIIRKAWGH